MAEKPGSGNESSDLYRQLIDSNDLVKELDDIEAISQQISQHAEVLYQKWKSNNNGNPNGRTSGDESEENKRLNPRSAPLLSPTFMEPSPSILNSYGNSPNQTLRSVNSAAAETSEKTNHPTKFLTLPARPTFLQNDNTLPSTQNTLDLLASPEINGNLKDLVSTFVSTDRAKQAARQTISSTISNLTRRSPTKVTPHSANEHYSTEIVKHTGETDTSVHSIMPTIFKNRSEKKSVPSDFIPIPVKHEVSNSSSRNDSLFLQNQAESKTDSHDDFLNRRDFKLRSDPSSTIDIKQRLEDVKSKMLAHQQGFGRSGVSSVKNIFEPHQDSLLEESAVNFLRPRSRTQIQLNRKSVPAPPHPELTPQQKQHIFERTSTQTSTLASSLPIHRFRNSGSVAERVLIFEKCPIFSNFQTSVPDNKNTSLNVITPASSLKPQLVKNDLQIPSQRPLEEEIEDDSIKEINIEKPSILREIPIQKSPQPQQFVIPSISPSKKPVTTHLYSPTKPLLTTKSKPGKVHISKKDSQRKISKCKEIPRFFFPFGDPASRHFSVDNCLKKMEDDFKKYGGFVNKEQLGSILKLNHICYYWKGIIFNACKQDKATLHFTQFSQYWKKILQSNFDEASQFTQIITKSPVRKDIIADDLVPLIQDVVDTHPGLGFLKEATEFHSRYVHTVIARIFFSVNRSWSGKITINELRKSNFLATLKLLCEEEDINRVTNYFSYEHFYVIYCKFWELDKDHDLFIDREDLSQHNDQAISTRMIDRIFSGTVTRGSAQREGKMSYTEFVWFLLAEEDKRSPTSIEYWFRCMDLDGDGYLSMYELEYFYEEQLTRMEQLGIETLPFEDCLCQMLDMIMPHEKNRISLKDLKSCRMTPIFFDTFFNLEKYLDHEQRDPFASQRELDEDGNEISDWDRFAAEEYELLVAEEGTNEALDSMCYDENEMDPDSHLRDANNTEDVIKS